MRLLCSNVKNLEKWMSGASLRASERSLHKQQCFGTKKKYVQMTIRNMLQIDFLIFWCGNLFLKCSKQLFRHLDSHSLCTADKRLHSDSENVFEDFKRFNFPLLQRKSNFNWMQIEMDAFWDRFIDVRQLKKLLEVKISCVKPLMTERL